MIAAPSRRHARHRVQRHGCALRQIVRMEHPESNRISMPLRQLQALRLESVLLVQHVEESLRQLRPPLWGRPQALSRPTLQLRDPLIARSCDSPFVRAHAPAPRVRRNLPFRRPSPQPVDCRVDTLGTRSSSFLVTPALFSESSSPDFLVTRSHKGLRPRLHPQIPQLGHPGEPIRRGTRGNQPIRPSPPLRIYEESR